MDKKHTRMIAIRISEDLYARVQEESDRSLRPVSAVIRLLLEKWLETHGDFDLATHRAADTIRVPVERAVKMKSTKRKRAVA